MVAACEFVFGGRDGWQGGFVYASYRENGGSSKTYM